MTTGWSFGWRMGALVTGLAVLVGLAGCGDRVLRSSPCGEGGCPPERVWTGLFQQSLNVDLDVLFVVDDTPSVADWQATSAAEYRRVGEALAGFPGGLPAIHVAVVSASLTPEGAPACPPPLSRASACGVVPPDQFLATASCGRWPNFTQPFPDTLACMAALGSRECGSLQPFASVRRAVDGAGAGGPLLGFFRPNAYLLVVIVAGHDDESRRDGAPTPVAELVALLKSLKADPHKVLVSVAGPSLDCADASLAGDAPRLKALANGFGVNGVYVSLCSDHAIRSAIAPAVAWDYDIGPPCLLHVRDTDPVTPGVQPDCLVEEWVIDPGSLENAGDFTKILPECAHAAAPCWTLTAPSGRCLAGELLLSVDRGPSWCPQDGTNMRVTCVGCANANDPACRGY
jgi:hypothetical protein